MGQPQDVLRTRCQERSSLAGHALCWPCIQYDQLLKEDVTACPLLLTQEDFEHFSKKLAVHAHADRPPEARNQSLRHLEFHLKEAILTSLPPYYVSLLEYDCAKQRSTGAKGGYTFKTKLPQEILYRTVENLGLWRRYNPDGEDDGFVGA